MSPTDDSVFTALSIDWTSAPALAAGLIAGFCGIKLRGSNGSAFLSDASNAAACWILIQMAFFIGLPIFGLNFDFDLNEAVANNSMLVVLALTYSAYISGATVFSMFKKEDQNED